MMHHSEVWIVLLGQVGLAALNACYWGPCTATMVELVPNRLRCTVLSVGYNAGVGILGGLTPMVAVYAIKRTQDDFSPAFFMMAAAAVSSVVIMGLRESYRMALPGSPEPTALEMATGSD